MIFYRGTTARHSFGFFYSTQLSHIYFFNILAYCIYRNQLKRTEYFIIVIIASIIFITTGSRNAFILTIVFLICYYMLFNQNNIYIWCYLRRYKEKIIYISKHFYTISFGLSFISSMLYNQQSFIFTKLNELLNNRLILGYNAIINYGIHLFGNYIKWIGMTEANTNQLYNYVDNSFLQILLTNGFVFICILLYFFYLLMKKLIDIKNYRLLLCLIFIAIHSLIDPQLLNIEMNIFLVLLVPFIYQKIYKGEKL